MEEHFAHLKEQANTGLVSKEARKCTVCTEGRKKLKGKYREKKDQGGGRTTSRGNEKKVLKGLAARMNHPMAMRLHYQDCIDNGWWEQLPPSMRPVQVS